MTDITFDYTNYRGEKSHRRIKVISTRHGVSDWHTSPQWLLRGFDFDKNEEREFAMADMSEVRPNGRVFVIKGAAWD